MRCVHACTYLQAMPPAPTTQRIIVKGGVIATYCESNAISRDELARRIGVARATAYRIDEGMVDPSPKFIAGLMHVTGLPFEDLFDIERDSAA